MGCQQMISMTEVTGIVETTDSAPKRIAGVRFQEVGKIYHFDASAQPDLRVGDFVIVETTRGRQMGTVASVESYTGQRSTEGSLKPIERRATGRDLAVRKYWEGKELEALVICREANKTLGLPIKIVKAEYSFDGARLAFLYSADSEDEKVDTKELRQEVSKSFHARIEMKLIGPRDVAKLLGGFGACGEVRCCSRFLTEFSPVSIKMAKEQGISLNPQEITGMCGRLRCCLVYEYEQYVMARKALPARNKDVGTPHGRGRVVDILPLKDSVTVLVGEQTFEVHREQIIPVEEWESLQRRAAEPCAGGENCTCGLHKPKAATSEDDAAPAQADVERRERAARRHQPLASPRGQPQGLAGGQPLGLPRGQRQHRRSERKAETHGTAPAGDAPPARPQRKQHPRRPAREHPDKTDA
jgi:cell fate regulator YaaT (PSP1 superfamily)